MHIASKRPAGLVSAFLTDESVGAPGHGFRADRTCSPRIRALQHGRAEVMKVGKRYRIRYRAWRTTHALGSTDRRAPTGGDAAIWSHPPPNPRRPGADAVGSTRVGSQPLGNVTAATRLPRRESTSAALSRYASQAGVWCRNVTKVVTIRPSPHVLGGSSAVQPVLSVRLACFDPRTDRDGEPLEWTRGGHAFPRPCVGRRRSNFSDGSRNI